MTTRYLRYSIFILLLAEAACGGDSPTRPVLPAGFGLVSAPQPGVVGAPLAEPVRVRVTDSDGAAVSGVSVAWVPSAGSVSAAASETDANGIAQTQWTLGTVAGVQHLTASIAGQSNLTPVQIDATAMAGPTTGVVIQPQDIALQPLESVSFVAEVAPDQYGNPVTTPVVWSTSDDISAPITTDGQVSGGRAGRAVVSATVGSVTAQTTVRITAVWQSIGAGRQHSCALDALGYPFCWGDNSLGQLGVADVAYDSIPRPVSGTHRFASLVVGAGHACGLTSDHVAYCWGYNSSGQLGIGTPSNAVHTPTPVAGGHLFASLASGNAHSCGIRTAGDAYCWGWEGEGQLGNGASLTFTSQQTPVAVLGGLTYGSITAGGSHTCAITSAGEPYCWGNNYEGQVGDGSGAGYRTTPVAVAGGLTVAHLTAGSSHSCALDAGGQTWCWGANGMGQVGDGTFQMRVVPVAISTPVPSAILSGGSRHTCALDAAGQAFCWGFNETGQLGDGTTLRKESPTPVSTDVRFAAVSAGVGHTCAITADGRAYCWGANQSGQLGMGSFAQQTSPALVSAP